MPTTIDVTNTAVFERRKSQIHCYCPSADAIFDTASGGIIRDPDGREYIDSLSGAGSLNYGHIDLDTLAALVDYLMRDGITHGCASTEPPSPGWDFGPSLRALCSEVLRNNAETQRTALL
jgi:4-aminobutyrate aminotransferase-like enzyme